MTAPLEGSLSDNMNDKFTIELCSDLDFEGMVVDISFSNQIIAMLNYEKGINNIEIEIFSSTDSSVKRVFLLKDFVNALESAKKLAIKCAKEDELKKSE